MSGGQPDAARLLALARRELLEEILPQVEGESRYRLRLVANALKIAARELEDGPEAARASAADIKAFLEIAGLDKAAGGPPEGAEGTLRAALRAGRLDGDSGLYEVLILATRRRLDHLG